MDSNIWSHLAYPDISIIEKIIRPIIVYSFLIIGLRLAGKKELAQLNTGDLVVVLMLSNTVQNAIIGEDNSVAGGIIGAITLLVVNHLWEKVLFKHQKLNRLVEGKPSVLIEGGEINHDRLKKEQLTLKELEIAGNKQGFGSLDEVDHAVLEPGGQFVFAGREPAPEAARHSELLARLDQITSELAELRAAQKQ